MRDGEREAAGRETGQELLTVPGRRRLGRHGSVDFFCCLPLRILDTCTALPGPLTLGNELRVGAVY